MSGSFVKNKYNCLVRVQYYSGTRLFRIRKRSENRIRMFCVFSDDVATANPNIRRKFPNVTRLKELRHLLTDLRVFVDV